MTNEEVLAQFLMNYDKLDMFRNSINVALPNSTKKLVVSTVIDTALKWSDLGEGTSYWHERYIEWENLCDNFNLTGYIDVTKV